MNRISPVYRRIAPYILLLPGFNPGPLTLEGTNTYVIGTTRSRLLIDTGERNNTAYLDNLKRTMESQQFQITKIAITHAHEAHMGGLTDVLRITECAHIFMNYDLKDSRLQRVKDFQRVQIETGLYGTFLHTPGHTKDHISIWIEESGDLFTGDCVIGGESAQFQDLEQQLESVEKLRNLKGLKRILPGKGTCDGKDPYQKEFQEYRLKREEEILKKLAQREGMSHAELVEQFYGGRFNRDDPRYKSGEQNMEAHLNKLLRQGRLKCHEEKYYLL